MPAKIIVKHLTIGFCFLFLFQKAKAQVIASDSLALVALYNAVPALHSDTTWMHGNVSTWKGVTVQDNKVFRLQLLSVIIGGPIPTEVCGFDSLQELAMDYCDLRGLVPGCVFEMPSLKLVEFVGNSLTGVEPGTDFSKMIRAENINLYFNEFTEMPDFLSIPSSQFYFLGVQYNRFNFDDLIPLLNKPTNTYRYSPQRELLGWRGFVVQAGDTANFPNVASLMGGTNNTYQWKQQISDSSFISDSPRLKNTTTSRMSVEGALAADGGTYICEATNPDLPDLVLNSGFIAMTVITPQPQTIVFQSDTTIYCPYTNYLIAHTTAGRAVSFASLDESLATVDGIALTPHRLGRVTIQATAPGDTLYLADTLNVELLVTVYNPLPSFEIISQLPEKESKELALSVPYRDYLTYRWITPGGQTYDTSAIKISSFTSSDFGNYTVQVTTGPCFISEASIAVNSFVYGKPVVYELITPNGDGDNETLYIENLNPALHNEVTVFNASHQILFHEENYQNDWDGQGLPVGTYYYQVKVGDNSYKGNLYIKR